MLSTIFSESATIKTMDLSKIYHWDQSLVASVIFANGYSLLSCWTTSEIHNWIFSLRSPRKQLFIRSRTKLPRDMQKSRYSPRLSGNSNKIKGPSVTRVDEHTFCGGPKIVAFPLFIGSPERLAATRCPVFVEGCDSVSFRHDCMELTPVVNHPEFGSVDSWFPEFQFVVPAARGSVTGEEWSVCSWNPT